MQPISGHLYDSIFCMYILNNFELKLELFSLVVVPKNGRKTNGHNANKSKVIDSNILQAAIRMSRLKVVNSLLAVIIHPMCFI